MRIGILTFHCAHNYGAVLQCYALQETLKNMGHEVEVINYRPEYLLTPFRRFNIKRYKSNNPFKIVKKTLREVLVARMRIKRYSAFHNFIQTMLNLSAKVQGRDIPSTYDIYIMGSDQIWNPKITKGFDPVYFGNFQFAKANKKYVAYAASMEACALAPEAIDFYRKSLCNFDSVSVREKQLAGLLQPLSEKPIETVLDPTLLAKAEIWHKIAKRPKYNGKYVLVYQVGRNGNTLKIANSIAQEIGAVVIEITAEIFASFNRRKLQCESPEEFLGWIKHASFVVTTSFHGTAFSIIFNRPFYCIELKKNGNTRCRSLLSSIGLENRLISILDMPRFSDQNYSYAYSCISKLQAQSLSFLTKAISTR